MGKNEIFRKQNTEHTQRRQKIDEMINEKHEKMRI